MQWMVLLVNLIFDCGRYITSGSSGFGLATTVHVYTTEDKIEN